MKPTPATNLWPIGHIANHAGTTVSEIDRVADALGLAPILWLCGVPYLCMEQAVLIEEALKAERVKQLEVETASKN